MITQISGHLQLLYIQTNLKLVVEAYDLREQLSDLEMHGINAYLGDLPDKGSDELMEAHKIDCARSDRTKRWAEDVEEHQQDRQEWDEDEEQQPLQHQTQQPHQQIQEQQ